MQQALACLKGCLQELCQEPARPSNRPISRRTGSFCGRIGVTPLGANAWLLVGLGLAGLQVLGGALVAASGGALLAQSLHLLLLGQ